MEAYCYRVAVVGKSFGLYTQGTQPLLSSSAMNRRRFLQFLSAPFILNGCSSSPLGQTMASISELTLGSRTSIDEEYVNNLPYASILVSRTNKQKVLLILGKVEDQKLHWISTEKSVLITQGGRIVQTVGLEENLVATRFLSAGRPLDFDVEQPSAESLQQTSRSIDIQPGNRFGIAVQTQTKPIGSEAVTILGKKHKTVLIEERCEARALSWSFNNLFWVGDDGIIWKSVQHIAPKQPAITMEVAKPYLA